MKKDLPIEKEAHSLMSSSLVSMKDRLRLDVYVIDSGWDSVAHSVLQRSMDLFKTYLTDHNLYLLSHEQSAEYLKAHPELIGQDPILIVVDHLAKKLHNPQGFGTLIALGLIKDRARVEWLIKMFLKIINTHTETLDIAYTFQQYNHKEGVKGTVDIIMESVGEMTMAH